jgi:ketosteroid isomerase-like protein
VIEADGVVVALWNETVRIRDSQSDIESSTASLIKVRDGRVVEMRGYMDRDEALRAAGLKDD